MPELDLGWRVGIFAAVVVFFIIVLAVIIYLVVNAHATIKSNQNDFLMIAPPAPPVQSGDWRDNQKEARKRRS